MVRLSLAVLALLALPLQAQDRPAWVGYWAQDPSWCARAGEPGEETPELIAPYGLFGLEYSCEFDAITPLGVGKSWRMDMTCLETGFEDSYRELFIVTNEDRLLRVAEDGYRTLLYRCAKSIED